VARTWLKDSTLNCKQWFETIKEILAVEGLTHTLKIITICFIFDTAFQEPKVTLQNNTSIIHQTTIQSSVDNWELQIVNNKRSRTNIIKWSCVIYTEVEERGNIEVEELFREQSE